MTDAKGMIVLMGSGELTSTMVELHKEMLQRLDKEQPLAVFLDTPAGFQLNVDQIARRAADYFRRRVGREMAVASFKSHAGAADGQAEAAFDRLRRADYVLVGPGSPTYAVRQLASSPIPEILARRVAEGACLTAASAAALTVGRYTLPVYEIYKVGQSPHWVEGLDLLARFGFNLTVVPHWNNAEGGTHDTRFCFMGEPNFRRLEALLPRETAILGLDEHTACILELARGRAAVRGIGQVTLRRGGREWRFPSGASIPLALLQGAEESQAAAAPGMQGMAASDPGPDGPPPPAIPPETLWPTLHALQTRFHAAMAQGLPAAAASALLELDRVVWSAHGDLEGAEFVSQAREILRELIVLLGAGGAAVSPVAAPDRLPPVVAQMLALRQRLRETRRWPEADAIRQALQRAGVGVEDTPAGARWHLLEAGPEGLAP